MEFRVLGPLEVADEGRLIPLGGPKQRSVLALLLLNANRVVSAGRLADEIWGGHAGAVRALQVYVSRLRKLLERHQPGAEGRSLLTRSPGYMLRVEADHFDLLRFETLSRDGRRALAAGDAAGAAEILGDALRLWRGPALADFVYQPFAQREAVHLEEARLAALEDRVDADLRLGRHAEVVAELERIVADHPLRERPWGQLMLTLYRSGRQSDALRAYERLRRTLGEELGIEPSANLVRLEEAILLHKPELDWAEVQPTGNKPASEATKPLPTGVVNFLLTDIERSTTLWEARPQAMALAVARHDELLHAAVTAHGGTVLKARGEGDSTFSVFNRATDAAAAAVSAQRAFLAEIWPDGVDLAVRMAIHAGETVERDGDYYGPTVNRAARVRALAQGGQILVGQSAAEVARSCLPAETSLDFLGPHVLQGIAEPEHVFALVGDGLTGVTGAASSSEDKQSRGTHPAPSTAYLELVRPDGRAFVSLCGNRMTIGRSLDNNIAFPQEQAVSRVHAVLERFAGAWCLRDLGSRNGTSVNGQVIRGEQVLREGDDVHVGPVRLVFCQDEFPAEATATG